MATVDEEEEFLEEMQLASSLNFPPEVQEAIEQVSLGGKH